MQLQGPACFELWLSDQSHSAPASGPNAQAATLLRAPFNGKLIALHVREGDSVKQGDALLVIESMKLEHTLAALLATSIRGAREQTGTSFATPFVTAAAALALGQNPTLGPTEVAALLAGSARDTGDVGRDDVFGHGMLQAGSLCPGPPAATDGAAGAAPPPGE